MSESVEIAPPFVPVAPIDRTTRTDLPTARQWVVHLSLFLLTAITTTLAGVYLVSPGVVPAEPPLATPLDYVMYIPRGYASVITAYVSYAYYHPDTLFQGLIFSSSLLAILTAHEMGHYLACRRYGVAATLPFFIPAPPLFLAGTFGAFIKIKSPIPSRRALLDIGLAGPLAGFIVAVPFAVIGVLQLQPGVASEGPALIFNDPPLFRLLGWLFNVPLDPFSLVNPYYMSAWIGLLVTSLNLMPVGQLDGGHGTFAVFGAKAHQRIGFFAFLAMATLSILGFIWHGSPSGFLYTILLAIMLRIRHPPTQWSEELGTKRILIAIITLIVFALSFWPFPMTII